MLLTLAIKIGFIHPLVWVLAIIGAVHLIAGLVEIFAKEGDLAKFARYMQKREEHKLLQALWSKNPRIRRRAARHLGARQSLKAVESLITVAEDPDPRVSEAALEALSEICDPRTIEFMLEKLKHRDWYVRYVAAGTLGAIGVRINKGTLDNECISGDLRQRVIQALIAGATDYDWFASCDDSVTRRAVYRQIYDALVLFGASKDQILELNLRNLDNSNVDIAREAAHHLRGYSLYAEGHKDAAKIITALSQKLDAQKNRELCVVAIEAIWMIVHKAMEDLAKRNLNLEEAGNILALIDNQALARLTALSEQDTQSGFSALRSAAKMALESIARLREIIAKAGSSKSLGVYLAWDDAPLEFRARYLGDEVRLIEDMVRDFIENEIPPEMVTSWDDQGTRMEEGRIIVPAGFRETLAKLAGLGVFGISTPEEYDGAGLKHYCADRVISMLSYVCPALAVTLGVNFSVQDAIRKFGTEEQKRKFLPKLATAGLGAIAITEPEAGSYVKGIKTAARQDGDTYILNGGKQFITSVGMASVYLVFAKTNKEKNEITAFLVEEGRQGFSLGSIEHKMGQNASPTGELIFENCRVPKENMLEGLGGGMRVLFYLLTGGRIGIASLARAIGKVASDAAHKYAGERKQSDSGKPITEFEEIQEMLADMDFYLAASGALMGYAVFLKDHIAETDTRQDANARVTAASMDKLFCSEGATGVALDAIQIHGGNGYIKDYLVERYLRDVIVTKIYEGPTQIQRLLIRRPENSGSLLDPEKRIGIEKMIDDYIAQDMPTEELQGAKDSVYKTTEEAKARICAAIRENRITKQVANAAIMLVIARLLLFRTMFFAQEGSVNAKIIEQNMKHAQEAARRLREFLLLHAARLADQAKTAKDQEPATSRFTVLKPTRREKALGKATGKIDLANGKFTFERGKALTLPSRFFEDLSLHEWRIVNGNRVKYDLYDVEGGACRINEGLERVFSRREEMKQAIPAKAIIPVEIRPQTPHKKLAEVCVVGGVKKIIFSWALLMRDLLGQFIVEVVLEEELRHYFNPQASRVHRVIDDYLASRIYTSFLFEVKEAKRLGIHAKATWLRDLGRLRAAAQGKAKPQPLLIIPGSTEAGIVTQFANDITEIVEKHLYLRDSVFGESTVTSIKGVPIAAAVIKSVDSELLKLQRELRRTMWNQPFTTFYSLAHQRFWQILVERIPENYLASPSSKKIEELNRKGVGFLLDMIGGHLCVCPEDLDCDSALKTSNASSLEETIVRYLEPILWASKVDLSRPKGSLDSSDADDPYENVRLIFDQRRQIAAQIMRSRRIDIVLDNLGPELISVLWLVNYLLNKNIVKEVVLHAKGTKVDSDNTGEWPPIMHFAGADVSSELHLMETIHQMITWQEVVEDSVVPGLFHRATGTEEDMRKLGLSLLGKMDRIELRTDPFWHSGKPMASITEERELYAEIVKSDLVIFLGGWYYRRILGNRTWAGVPVEERPYLADVLNYWPTDVAIPLLHKGNYGYIGLPHDLVMFMETRNPGKEPKGVHGSFLYVPNPSARRRSSPPEPDNPPYHSTDLFRKLDVPLRLPLPDGPLEGVLAAAKQRLGPRFATTRFATADSVKPQDPHRAKPGMQPTAAQIEEDISKAKGITDKEYRRAYLNGIKEAIKRVGDDRDAKVTRALEMLKDTIVPRAGPFTYIWGTYRNKILYLDLSLLATSANLTELILTLIHEARVIAYPESKDAENELFAMLCILPEYNIAPEQKESDLGAGGIVRLIKKHLGLAPWMIALKAEEELDDHNKYGWQARLTPGYEFTQGYFKALRSLYIKDALSDKKVIYYPGAYFDV
ncbi:DUF89 family protein, partial [bacterium]